MHPAHTRRTLTGAVTRAALPAAAQSGPHLPFAVPPTTIPLNGTIRPKTNGALRHSPNLRGTTCSIAGQISPFPTASKPQPGNLISFSTPENIGPVVPGEVMQAHMHVLPGIRVPVVAA